ncbi:MAG: DUF1186 domain-containing protein [Saprospiraceae bacterium]
MTIEKADTIMTGLRFGYTITTDPNDLNELNGITPELLPKLEKYHLMALEGKESSIKKLLDVIQQYPQIPHFKNYLSVLYNQLNWTNKAFEVNKWIIAEHPDYLFGKLNKANEYYLNGQYDKMPSVLGQDMELKALYPERELFHLNEVLSFLICAVRYFTAKENLEQAEIRYQIMLELDPDSDNTRIAGKEIFDATMKAAQKRFQEEKRTRISVKTRPQEIKTMAQKPEFSHQEIEWLYTHGLRIGTNKLNTILSLPKQTLVRDLELVLQDSIDRFEYFRVWVDNNHWDEERMTFVIHAVSLLGELGSVKSLDMIFKMLSQSEEYFELYFGDFLTSFFWEPFYKIAANRLEACKQFMCRPGIDTYAKAIISEVVGQIALHHPERRTEAIGWFGDVVDFFLVSSLEDNVIDSDVIAFLICDVIDIEGSELLPGIEQLFEQGRVSTGICGKWKEVKDALERPDSLDNRRKILSIGDRYKEILFEGAGYVERDIKHDPALLDVFRSSFNPVKAEPKIGRNAPCPCGSGKKYKKCCLDK